jgi:hypothetical protein
MYVNDIDRAFEGFRTVESVVLLEDVDEGVLPLLNVVHWLLKFKFNYINSNTSIS